MGWIGILKVIISVTAWESKVGRFRIQGKVWPALFVLSFLNPIKVFARYNVKVVVFFMSASFQVNELFEAVAVASIECRSWQRATAAA